MEGIVCRGRVVYADHGVSNYHSRGVWQVTIHYGDCPSISGYQLRLSHEDRDLIERQGIGTYFRMAGHSPGVRRYVLCRTCKPNVTQARVRMQDA